MFKKILLLLAALILVSGLAFGQSYAQDGMLIQPGSVNVNAGIGYSYHSYGIDVGGGAEVAIGKFMLGETLPFTYGLAARIGFAIARDYVDPLSLGAFGTLHFCWGALDLPPELAWIGNFDSYLGLGLNFLPALYFNSIGGFSYFFNEYLALNLEAGLRSSYIGLLFKL